MTQPSPAKVLHANIYMPRAMHYGDYVQLLRKPLAGGAVLLGLLEALQRHTLTPHNRLHVLLHRMLPSACDFSAFNIKAGACYKHPPVSHDSEHLVLQPNTLVPCHKITKLIPLSC